MILTTPLQQALTQLLKHIELAGSAAAQDNADLRTAFRTAAIKSFEYAYELSIKLIRRQLELADSAELVDAMDFRTLIRTAAEWGLVTDPAAWFHFRENRNIIPDAYDEMKAIDILSHLPAFAAATEGLLAAVGGAGSRTRA